MVQVLKLNILAGILVVGKLSVCLICMKYRIIIFGTRVRTHCRRTGYRYSVAPSRDGLLRWRQCRLLAIEIKVGSGGPVSSRFLVFFAYKKF